MNALGATRPAFAAIATKVGHMAEHAGANKTSPEDETRTMLSPPQTAITADGVNMQALPEEMLIEHARLAKQDAISELIRRYQDAIYNLCYRMLGDAHEAEDATQEVFVKMYRHLDKYKSSYRFSTWLLSIASHHCIDRLRKRRVSWVSLDAPNVRNTYSSPPRVEELVIQREEQNHIQQLLDTLKPDQRLVLILHYWYDLSYHEIAQILGSTEGAVKTRAHRARRQLGRMLQQEGWSP